MVFYSWLDNREGILAVHHTDMWPPPRFVYDISQVVYVGEDKGGSVLSGSLDWEAQPSLPLSETI